MTMFSILPYFIRAGITLTAAIAAMLFPHVGHADDEEPSMPPTPPAEEPEPEADENEPQTPAEKTRPVAAANTARQISEGIRWVADQVRASVVRMRGATLCSGIIVDSDGYILTILSEVGKGAVTVALNGENLRGKVVASDPSADLALVKIDARNLPVARLGDSNAMEVGDVIVSVGAPFGFQHSVTTGIISYKNRKRKPDVPMLQNTVTSDSNNAGAPLVNVNGEVVGISWAIAGNNFIGIGYAVPINAFKQGLQKHIPTK